MRILFIGWNENGEKCLSTLLKDGHKIQQLILPGGYETDMMKQIASKHSLPIYEYEKDLDKLKEVILGVDPELIVVASFPKLIPQDIIDLPKYGVINVHTGELPKYRGYHPLNWALIRDEPRIGVTVHYIDEGMDTGNVLAQGTVEVTNKDDILTIKDRTTTLGAELLGGVINEVVTTKRRLPGTEQRDSQVLFAPLRRPGDSKIKWSNNSRDIFNLVRAVTGPYPNAFGLKEDDQPVEFASSYLPAEPGVVIGEIDGHYVVTTGDGVIMLKSNQPLKIGTRLK